MSNPLTMLKHALQNNQLSAYLMGEKGYRFHDRWVETPTDVSAIFINGFNAYVTENKANKGKLEAEVDKSLRQMLKEPVGTWWTLSILYSYFFGYKADSLFFRIDIIPLIPHISRSLAQFKEDLMSNKEWVGWRFENGLWDDIVFMVNKINETLTNEKVRIPIH